MTAPLNSAPVHIRNLRTAVMLCGAREFEPGKPRNKGIYQPNRATCEACKTELARRRAPRREP